MTQDQDVEIEQLVEQLTSGKLDRESFLRKISTLATDASEKTTQDSVLKDRFDLALAKLQRV